MPGRVELYLVDAVAVAVVRLQRGQVGVGSAGVLDRLVYDSYDPLLSLAAAAAVTSRVKLATTIVVGLLHNTPVLAKMAASLDALSGGRFVLTSRCATCASACTPASVRPDP